MKNTLIALCLLFALCFFIYKRSIKQRAKWTLYKCKDGHSAISGAIYNCWDSETLFGIKQSIWLWEDDYEYKVEPGMYHTLQRQLYDEWNTRSKFLIPERSY